MRTITLNARYIVLLNNPKDRSSIIHLAKQMSPHNTKYIMEAYKQAVVDVKWGYLVFDFNISTPEKFRIRNRLYPTDDMLIFVPV